MFEKSDKTLAKVRLTMLILLAVLGILYLVQAILMFVNGGAMQGVIYLISAAAIPVVGWVLLEYALACAADLKVIRNKLYGESNRPIAPFFTDSEYTEPQPQDADAGKLSALVSELKALKALADDGTITQEEFEKVKAKYLKNI